MRSGQSPASAAARLWWTVPVGLVFLTAVVFVAVVLPALAGGSGVPAQLDVHRSPAPSAPASKPPAKPTSTPGAHPTQASPTPVPVRTTTVVTPVQPVVHASDDRHDDGAGNASGEPRDR